MRSFGQAVTGGERGQVLTQRASPGDVRVRSCWPCVRQGRASVPPSKLCSTHDCLLHWLLLFLGTNPVLHHLSPCPKGLTAFFRSSRKFIGERKSFSFMRISINSWDLAEITGNRMFFLNAMISNGIAAPRLQFSGVSLS